LDSGLFFSNSGNKVVKLADAVSVMKDHASYRPSRPRVAGWPEKSP
jgi:hypothetical protein